MSLLTAREVSKRYGPVVALRSATLVVEPGEVHALLGANGAGKSTLVKVLTGVIRPDGGTILVNGQASSVSSPAQAARIGLAPVFQDPALVPDLTVAQNLRLTRTPVAAVRRHLRDLDLDIDFDEQAYDVPLPLLRMIDLARALARDPQLLILDEITAALPADLAERVFDVMRRQKESGRSALFITHRLREVIAHCDRATVLRDGGDVGTLDPAGGRRGEDRRVHARRGGRACGRRRRGDPGAGADRAPRRADGARGARAPGRRDAHRRVVRAPSGRDPRDRGARGAGPGRALRRALRPAAPDRRRHPRPGEAAACAPSLRRDPRRRRPRAGRPAAGAAAAALDRREHRRPAVQQRAPLGAGRHARGAQACAGRDRRTLDRHARPAAGAPALGRQPAEGDDRALARERVPDAALLRPDPRHRRRHEAPDLRAAAAARGGRSRRAPVHERAGRDPARLRPRRLPLRRQGDRRARRRSAPTRRRSCARCTGSRATQHERCRRGAGADGDPLAAARAPTRLDGGRLPPPRRPDPLLADDSGRSGGPSTSSRSRSTRSPSPSPRWRRRSWSFPAGSISRSAR